ncbi:MAG: glycosyltransferase family 39 protein [Elusimicrobiota bacterium]|nr:MAG: glycosyltransferase family 39 protein [Elusimicrobiota bacterium]
MDAVEASVLSTDARRFDARAFAFALVLRLAFTGAFLFKGLDAAYGRDLYYNLALSWLGWAPAFAFDATHPPLYTALIAAVLGLFRSPNPLPVLLLQCVLGAACVPLTRLLGERLGAGPKASRLAALWIAVDPGLLFYTPQLGTEALFVFMELVLFVFLYAELDSKPGVALAGVGVWGGLTALCRSVIGGYPAFLFLVLWRARGLAKAFAFCAVLGIGWLAPSLLWSVRNYVKYDRVVPVAAVMGWNMWEGFSLDREVIRQRPYEMGEEAKALGLMEDPIARGDHFAKKTTSFIKGNPGQALKIIVGKALLFWRPMPYDPHSRIIRGALGIYFSILFVLAVYGARLVWSQSVWSPVWALFAYLTALHSIFFTSLRYRLPLEPFLCILASIAIMKLMADRSEHA